MSEPTSKPRPRGGRMRPDAREEVARLHVRGVPRKAIARRLGCAEETVSRWLHEPATQKLVHDLAQDAMREARAVLERFGLESANTLVKVLRGQGGRNSKERRLAAESILDRIGLVRGSKQETEVTVQGNPAAIVIAQQVEKLRARKGSE